MAALAYVLLPLSGVVAFLIGSSARVRFHGLQAIAFGALWAVAAYVASWISPTITAVVFVIGALLWVTLLVTSLAGRDVRLPGARFLEEVARSSRRGPELL